MKRFYGLLLVAAALVSGAVHGMEVNIRDYSNVINYIIGNKSGLNAELSKYDDFEAFAEKVVPEIEKFMLQHEDLQDEKHYHTLCATYLNHYFNSMECSPEQVETMIKDRFVQKLDTELRMSPLALFYSLYAQETVSYLTSNKLTRVVQNAIAKDPKSIDSLLEWAFIFDNTGHACEQLLCDALSKAIESKGLTIQMSSKERLLLHKGGGLQGLAKGIHIDVLRKQELDERSEREKSKKDADNKKDQMAGQFFALLKQNKIEQLKELLIDQCLGGVAPFGDHRDYIDKAVKERAAKTIKNEKEREVLLNLWKDTSDSLFKFEDNDQIKDMIQSGHKQYLQAQRTKREKQEQKEEEDRKEKEKIKQQRFEEQQRQIEAQRQEEERERKRQEEINQRKLEEQRQLTEQRAHEAAEERTRKENQERADRDEQQRLGEENKRVQEEKKNKDASNKPDDNKKPEEPIAGNLGGDNAKGGAVAFLASIGAPKFVAAAVVAGVCYWGYTKYQAYKQEQQAKQEQQEQQEKERKENTQNLQT